MSNNTNKLWEQIEKLEQSYEKLNLPFDWTYIRELSEEEITEKIKNDSALCKTKTYVKQYQKFIEAALLAAVPQQQQQAPLNAERIKCLDLNQLQIDPLTKLPNPPTEFINTNPQPYKIIYSALFNLAISNALNLAASSSTQTELDWSFQVYNYLIQHSLVEILGNNYPLHHNSTHSQSTKSNCKPDVFVELRNGMMFLKGEEKSTATGIEKAQNELTEKMNAWVVNTYGNLPYFFAYCTSGPNISFHYVAPPKTLYNLGKKACYNLLLIEDVYEVVRIFSLLALFVPLMENCWPKELQGATNYTNRTINRDDKTLKFSETDFKKQYNLTFQKADVVKKIYEFMMLNTQQFKFLVRCTKVEQNTSLVVNLEPIGLEMIPKTVDEVKDAIWCVLQGLKVWHFLGWCHGDIRWANIVRLAERTENGIICLDNWMLIDFDQSGENNKRKIDWNHKYGRLHDNNLTFEHDFLQVADLFGSCNRNENSNQFVEFVELLKDSKNKTLGDFYPKLLFHSWLIGNSTKQQKVCVGSKISILYDVTNQKGKTTQKYYSCEIIDQRRRNPSEVCVRWIQTNNNSDWINLDAVEFKVDKF